MKIIQNNFKSYDENNKFDYYHPSLNIICPHCTSILEFNPNKDIKTHNGIGLYYIVCLACLRDIPLESDKLHRVVVMDEWEKEAQLKKIGKPQSKLKEWFTPKYLLNKFNP